MGLAGSGKGTQSKLLAELLGCAYFSMGEVLREYAKKDDELGRRTKSLIDQGIIVTEEIIKQVFTKKLEGLREEGLIIDGFPRTLYQAKLLEELMQEHGINDLQAIFLDVDQEKLMKRILKRAQGQSQHRADDNPEGIKKRFKEYEDKTAEAQKYLEEKGLLRRINGDQSVEQVHEDIKKELGI